MKTNFDNTQTRAAELKLKRARQHGEFDPVSGFSVEEIENYLAIAAVGLDDNFTGDIIVAGAVCRRNGIPF